MGQHRRTQKYRRIVVTAVAVGAVGVPSVALACSDWPYGGEDPSHAAAANALVGQTSAAVPQWQSALGGQTTAPAAPPATARPSAAGAEKAEKVEKRVVVHKRAARTTAHRAPRATHHHPGGPVATASDASAAPSVPAVPAAPAAPAAPSTPAAASTPEATATASGTTAQILRLVNDEREKAGCQDLALNPKLTKAAQDHSADMAAHQNMSHTGSDGSSPGDRITGAGYSWSSYGENIAYGYTTADQVMAGWMSSPGHRANILNCAFKEIGVGLAQPGSYWTQDFGTAG
ncbi:CAP domain-containing protein [Streptomyces sp. NPDC051452]|uniref:CAP domain-containing protein n=1 Tax=Streptomyces sp. NPDC051452 TaxID=3365654 RepID=UPI0037BDC2B6